ncbi:MAG: hypothetical protein DYH05_00140 [Acidobacteria bacterium ACB1]|nr:hypothetical protein [Acidobacteria bacterium ACB1]RIJ93991.1 MAG: hypothetical protein DCC44_05875 [Acidobacteriota bacterium]
MGAYRKAVALSFANFAAFASRPLRLPPIELHVISLCTLHVDPNAKNAKVIAKLSKTLPRDSFPCVLCGPRSATFAFTAGPESLVPL